MLSRPLTFASKSIDSSSATNSPVVVVDHESSSHPCHHLLLPLLPDQNVTTRSVTVVRLFKRHVHVALDRYVWAVDWKQVFVLLWVGHEAAAQPRADSRVALDRDVKEFHLADFSDGSNRNLFILFDLGTVHSLGYIGLQVFGLRGVWRIFFGLE